MNTRDIIQGLLDLYWKEQCMHEETYRGGTIWTICQACGRKWADDEGGFKPHEAPEVVQKAEEWLKNPPKPEREKTLERKLRAHQNVTKAVRDLMVAFSSLQHDLAMADKVQKTNQSP